MNKVYLDYASLTPIDKRVVRVMVDHANPSSIYAAGVAAKKILEKSRADVAKFLNAHTDEIVFTSGGTESNCLALEGTARAFRNNYTINGAGSADGIGENVKPHLIISSIEHSSVIEMAKMLEKHGCEVTRISVDQSGVVSPDELKKAIKPNTFLVSIMTVNNEIGTIQPIREIAKIIRHARANITKNQYPLFHTDAAQALLYYRGLDAEKMGIDLITLDSIKAYGPRGVGALFVKRGTPIETITYGGGQENGLRSGTENVTGISGFAKALEIAALEREEEITRIVGLRDYFIEQLKKRFPAMMTHGAYASGDSEKRIANNINVTLARRGKDDITDMSIDHEFFLLQLDERGVMCSTKSACLRDEDESYVIRALYSGQKKTQQSLRFSLGRFTTKKDINKAIKAIDDILSL